MPPCACCYAAVPLPKCLHERVTPLHRAFGRGLGYGSNLTDTDTAQHIFDHIIHRTTARVISNALYGTRISSVSVHLPFFFFFFFLRLCRSSRDCGP